MRVTVGHALVWLAAIVTAGCEPLFDVEGSLFPAWLISILLGLALTLAGHWTLVRTRLDSHVGPRLLFYPSLFVLCTFLIWLVLYRT